MSIKNPFGILALSLTAAVLSSTGCGPTCKTDVQVRDAESHAPIVGGAVMADSGDKWWCKMTSAATDEEGVAHLRTYRGWNHMDVAVDPERRQPGRMRVFFLNGDLFPDDGTTWVRLEGRDRIRPDSLRRAVELRIAGGEGCRPTSAGAHP